MLQTKLFRWRLAAWAGFCGAVTAPVAGQSCPQGVVSRLSIENHSVFAGDRLEDGGRFRWAYRIVNGLHVRTRERFIRGELLFAEGDCYDPLLVQESERLLREHRFIARSETSSVRRSDGSWEVTVETQDEWTTNVDLAMGGDGGLHVERLDVTELNMIGRGILVGGFYRDRDGRADAGVRVELPRLMGTRTDSRLSLGRTRGGDIIEQSFTFPFVGEVGRFAGREVFARRTSSFAYSLGAGPHPVKGSVTHVLLPLDEQRFEVTVAGRIGSLGNLTIFGVGFSNETLQFPDFPSGIEVAVDGNYSATRPADDATIAAILPQTLHSSGTHVNLLAGQRNVRFERFTGLDALRGTQDVALGTDLAFTLGKSLAAVSSGVAQPEDLYARVRVQAALAPRPFLFRLDGGFEGRQIYSGGVSGRGWKDALGEVAAQIYWQPVGASRHTVVARASAGGGWNLTQPFQLTLGGAGGVRGFDQNDFPGGRRLVLNVEDRIYLGWPHPQSFDLGVTLFGDAGRAWADETPFGRDSGWKGTVGAGLRVGFPAGSRRVARLDFAWPVVGRGFGAPLFRVALGDPIGLSVGLEDRQLSRSQRLAVGADLFTEHGR